MPLTVKMQSGRNRLDKPVCVTHMKLTISFVLLVFPQVSRLHSDLVKWTVKLLLAMTRVEDQEKKELMSPRGQRLEVEGEGGPLAITASGEDAEQEHLKHVESTTDLKNECIALAQTLSGFTKQLNK